MAVDNGVCTVESGLVSEAKCIVETDRSDYLAIERGEIRPEVAFMQGNLKISNCRIPDDHLSKRLWKLTIAREGLGKLLQTLQSQRR